VLPINQIICGDNVATMATFPDSCIDLVVTSPPYDNLRTYGGHSWDFEGVAQQLWRIIKPGGVVVWIVADATIDGSETGTSFRQALRFKEIGFRLHDTMIWHKPTAMPITGPRYNPEFEFCFVLSSGPPSAFNAIRVPTLHPGVYRAAMSTTRHSDSCATNAMIGKVRNTGDDKPAGNVWSVANGQAAGDDVAAHGHPGCFPEALARDHILSWSNEGDVVLDPFSGSGTTAKMARLMGRRYLGIEINPDYCEMGRKRLKEQLLPFMAPQASDKTCKESPDPVTLSAETGPTKPKE
jgi:site-specific DNA-methyltransferase (adenine-specific)